MEAIAQVPKTALDVFRMLPEGTLCEVINNVLYMSPAPKYNHQKLVGLFYRKIFGHLELEKTGEVILSPFDVYFDDLLSAVQPDIIYFLNENKDILKDDGSIHGVPNILIEILSSDKKRDTVSKRILYEKAGVKEYIIADPATGFLQRLELVNKSYELTFEGEGVFNSALLNLEFNF